MDLTSRITLNIPCNILNIVMLTVPSGHVNDVMCNESATIRRKEHSGMNDGHSNVSYVCQVRRQTRRRESRVLQFSQHLILKICSTAWDLAWILVAEQTLMKVPPFRGKNIPGMNDGHSNVCAPGEKADAAAGEQSAPIPVGAGLATS